MSRDVLVRELSFMPGDPKPTRRSRSWWPLIVLAIVVASLFLHFVVEKAAVDPIIEKAHAAEGVSDEDVKKQYPRLFYKQSWYEDEAFAKEVIPAGKWEVRLEAMPDSFSKTWEEQQKLMPDIPYEVPPAAVLLFAICEHYQNTGERAFADHYVRTASLDSDGNRVGVAHFDADGLDVYDYWDGRRVSGLGVSASRKIGPRTLDPLVPSESLSLESLSARIAKIEHTLAHYNLGL